MSQFKESGYLFLQNFELGANEIREHLVSKIKKVEKLENIDLGSYKFHINVVCNKNDKKLGYSYVWTNKIEIYNLFCGLNLDGSPRVREYDDPNWIPPEEKSLEDTDDWGTLADEEDNQLCPKIKEELPPLVDISCYEPGNYDIRIGPLIVNTIGKNIIYSKNIDNWITEKIINYHIGFFEKDKRKYKNSRTGKMYSYPLINISRDEKRGNNLTITFSPKHPFTASFLINIVKKLKIKNNNNEKLIFFSQSKN